MKKALAKFEVSAKNSHRGGDYNDPSFTPVDEWPAGKKSGRKKKGKKK